MVDMIITCPSCDAQYLLPDDAVGAKGRRVKCTTCDYTWLQPSDQTPVSPAIEAFPEIIIPRDYSENSKVERQHFVPETTSTAPNGRAVLNGISIALLLTALTLGAAVLIRKNVVMWWPPSALLFETLHVPVPTAAQGLVLKDVVTDTENGAVLSVAGKIYNPGNVNVPLSRLEVRLDGKTGWLKDWSINLYGKTLAAGKEIDFQYKLQGAPQGGEKVTLRLVD